ncbi:MAG: carboxypeptidase regulatory-like domain-containing protein, partial [Planctomycetes bacterium]|nr:carboxypeptidase regulatory-like domain-containing protein [Planctomycetota bacterium]
NRVSFSHAPEPIITGQFDMIKVGPNDIVAIGSDEEGVKAWPISVSRGKVSPASVPLAGRVVDNEGRPLVGAIVERSPNRYTADDWLEDEETKLDLWKSAPRLIGSPRLAYRSIDPARSHPTVETGVDGRFRFDSVRLGEYVLTVEAEGHAPQHRHVKVEPRPEAQRFELKKGRLVRGQVVDQGGTPLAGVCVVLNRWHCHTDPRGYYHWALDAPIADAVNVRVYKRYVRGYETLKATFPLARIENQPIVLKSIP